MIVRKLRLQRGWSQDQLAELTGLSVRTIQRLEKGQSPSLESARSLAAVFEVDLSTFQPQDDDMQINPQILSDEIEALRYGKRVMAFYHGIISWLVLAVVFFAVFGFGEPVLYWAFAGSAIGLGIQGLLAYEIVRLPTVDWEKRLVERRLGRKL